jgi:hypothetical protein
MKRSTSGLSGSSQAFKAKRQRASEKTEPKKSSKPTQTSSSEVPKPTPLWKIIGSSNQEAVTLDPKNLTRKLDVNNPSTANEENDPSGAVRNGWYHQRYDPEFITGCDSSCRACKGKGDRIAV